MSSVTTPQTTWSDNFYQIFESSTFYDQSQITTPSNATIAGKTDFYVTDCTLKDRSIDNFIVNNDVKVNSLNVESLKNYPDGAINTTSMPIENQEANFRDVVLNDDDNSIIFNLGTGDFDHKINLFDCDITTARYLIRLYGYPLRRFKIYDSYIQAERQDNETFTISSFKPESDQETISSKEIYIQPGARYYNVIGDTLRNVWINMNAEQVSPDSREELNAVVADPNAPIFLIPNDTLEVIGFDTDSLSNIEATEQLLPGVIYEYKSNLNISGDSLTLDTFLIGTGTGGTTTFTGANPTEEAQIFKYGTVTLQWEGNTINLDTYGECRDALVDGFFSNATNQFKFEFTTAPSSSAPVYVIGQRYRNVAAVGRWERQ